MATANLTDKAVISARAEPGSRLELWDVKARGLCLRVSDTKKVWVYRYRTADGRQPRQTLGAYTSLQGLAWARREADKIKVLVAEGKDPAATKKRERATAKAQPIKTFNDLADAYMAACETGEWKPKNKRKRERTLFDERGILRRHIRPALGAANLDSITRADVRRFLRAMVERGIGRQTNLAHAVTRQVFAYAISEERVALNPATGFAPLATETPRVRTLADTELRTFWRTLDDWPNDLRQPVSEGEEKGLSVTVGRPMRIILQLAILLLQRRSEIAGMALAELDLDRGLWQIPAARMKGGAPHMVPLPPSAVTLIREAQKLAAADGIESPMVFPSPRNPQKAILGNSVTHAMAEIFSALQLAKASPHDLRRTGSTALTSERLSVSPFIRSKVLGHRSDTGGGAAVSMMHYDTNEYLAEKRRALEGWELLVLNIAK